MRRSKRSKNGFTLIELLLVLAIMSILAAIIFLALNPQRQLGSARDRRRHNDLNSISNAIYQYQIDTNLLPPGIPTLAEQQICRTGAASCVNGVDLSPLTQSGKYLVAMPTDPRASETGTGTDYWILRDSNRRITLTAPLAEETETGTILSVTK